MARRNGTGQGARGAETEEHGAAGDGQRRAIGSRPIEEEAARNGADDAGQAVEQKEKGIEKNIAIYIFSKI